MNNFGSRLKAIRTTTGLTQKDFAKKAGISRTAYSNIELNIQSPSFSILINLQNQYNISVDWILTGNGNMFLDSKSKTVGTVFPKIKDEYSEMISTLFSLPEKLRDQILELWKHQLEIFLENVKSSPKRIIKRK